MSDDENGLTFEHTHNWFPVGVDYRSGTSILTEVCQGGMVRAGEDKCTAWRERELDYDDAVELVSTEEDGRGEIDGLLTGGSE